MASPLIAALDQALKLAGEDIILRRTVGKGDNQVNVDVTCRARVVAVSVEQLAAGIPATDLNLILSPSEINAAQWPGGQLPAVPPLNIDQRIPRAGVTDKIVMRGLAPKAITFVDPQIIGGELVRINMRIAG